MRWFKRWLSPPETKEPDFPYVMWVFHPKADITAFELAKIVANLSGFQCAPRAGVYFLEDAPPHVLFGEHAARHWRRV